MPEFTEEWLQSQGYDLNPDPSLGDRTRTDRLIDDNARKRERLLPSAEASNGVRQGALRVTSHGPRLEETEPSNGKPTLAGLVGDQIALAEAEESGTLRRRSAAVALRELGAGQP